MYRRILVALDGSDLAEQVLPQVEAIAEKFGATVMLLQVMPPAPAIMPAPGATIAPMTEPVVYPAPAVAQQREAVAGYLAALADRLRSKGIDCSYEHPDGPPGEVLVERARRGDVDLIAMTTHGRSGLERAVLGSVADEVLRTASCPVLVVRVREQGEGR